MRLGFEEFGGERTCRSSTGSLVVLDFGPRSCWRHQLADSVSCDSRCHRDIAICERWGLNVAIARQMNRKMGRLSAVVFA